MQDEILKHTEKVYKELKNSNHSFIEKLKEVGIEIVIIVFAVTLSIWFHSWSEHGHQQAEAREFLLDLRNDIVKDTVSMSNEKKSLNSSLKDYYYVCDLSDKQMDTIKNFRYNVSLVTRKTNDGNYEGFKSSGKIGFIENKKLKSSILQYYQEGMPSLSDIEKLNYLKNLEILEMFGGMSQKEKPFRNLILKSKMNLCKQISKGIVTAYDENIKQAKEILSEIDKETKK